MNDITLYSVREGSIVFSKEPVLTIKGSLAKVQLLETTILNLLN